MARTIAMLTCMLTSLSLIIAEKLPDVDYDVLVVGGGPAGSSALSALRRVDRSVVLFDSGEYRNALARYMQDVIGHDGKQSINVAAFRSRQWSQESFQLRSALQHENRSPSIGLAKLPIDAKLLSIIHSQEHGHNSFIADEGFGGVIITRAIILGTGIMDLFEGTPGLLDALAKACTGANDVTAASTETSLWVL